MNKNKKHAPEAPSLKYNAEERLKNAEKDIRLSELRLKRAELASKSGNWELHLDSQKIIFSEGAKNLYGIGGDQSKYEVLKEIPLPEYRTLLDAALNSLIEENKPYDVEFKIKTADTGEIKDIHSIATFDKENRILFGIIQDITGRKLMEDRIHESEQYYRTLVETSPDATIIIDTTGQIQYASHRAYQIFGVPEDQPVKGSPILGWIAPNMHETISERFKGILSGSINPEPLEYELIRNDGKMIWVEIHGSRIQKADGRLQGLLLVCHDITRRKQAEDSMRESMQLFQGLFNASPDSIILIDPHHPTVSWPIVDCNKATCQMNGFTREELVGQSIDLLNTTEGLPEERIAYMEELRQSGTIRMETSHRHKDGHIITVEVSTSLVTLGGREMVLGIDRDISERRLADEKSHESEEKFRMVFENVFDGIVIYEEYPDLSLRKLVDCNEQYAAMAGLTREELLKYKNTNDIQVSLQESSNDVRIESLSTRKAFRGSYSWIRPDGRDNIIEFIGVPVMWRGKSYTIGIDRDITMSKKIESELIAAKEKAEESDRLKSTFLANMSHEIRTPLNSIIGFSELMTDPDYEPSQQLQFAQIIHSSGNNLLAIISDIMDISKIESGQVQVKKRLFSVNQLIIDIQKEYLFIAIEKGIELRLNHLNPKEEVFIESDETKLKQILVNFVGNAIKFTKAGFIEIGFEIVEGFIQFHVKDTGIGIPKEFHQQIFERFRQVETSNTRKYGGNGLGLAISKGLVELLGGTLWMESELESGSTFYFSVPNGK